MARTSMLGGHVDRVMSDRGFGFIKDDGGRSYFFHASSVIGPLRFAELGPGTEVVFDIEPSDRGPRATNVQAV